jgi:hypothetical protein
MTLLVFKSRFKKYGYQHKIPQDVFTRSSFQFFDDGVTVINVYKGIAVIKNIMTTQSKVIRIIFLTMRGKNLV